MPNFLEEAHGDDGRNMAALYTPFGKQSALAMSQGWFPETDDKGVVTYKNKYTNAFNNVILPNKNERGHIALIGYPNQKFDIVIRDKNGNIEHTVYKGISPEDVQKYITNDQSVVAQRNNSVVAGANIDKPDEQGGYVGIMK